MLLYQENTAAMKPHKANAEQEYDKYASPDQVNPRLNTSVVAVIICQIPPMTEPEPTQ